MEISFFSSFPGFFKDYNSQHTFIFPTPNQSNAQMHAHKLTHTCTSELHLQQVVTAFSGGWGGRKESKGKKVSRLSITELSECYLCQTPTILSSDTETASRTSGRRGKHSRTPREVWQRQSMQQAQNTHVSAHTRTNTHIQHTQWVHISTHMHGYKDKYLHHLIMQKLSRLHKRDAGNTVVAVLWIALIKVTWKNIHFKLKNIKN